MAGGLLKELLELADGHPADAAVQLVAFRGCWAAFAAGLKHALVRVNAIRTATELVPRLPPDDEAKNWVRLLVDLVLACLERGAGAAQSELDKAGEALRRAYKAHFGDT